MFKDLWDIRIKQTARESKALAAQLAKVDLEISQFVDRVLSISEPRMLAAIEAAYASWRKRN